jgi:DNA-binding winged helix-turn-helix (wHTH) protein/TolB-like protein
MNSERRTVVFGNFRFNVATRELLEVEADGSLSPISLGSRASDLLFLFVTRPGELITKNEIFDAVWPNIAVEDSNLTVQISALRRALDRGGACASCIQTVPGRGYRFTFAIQDAKGGGPPGVPAFNSLPVPNERSRTTPVYARRWLFGSIGLLAMTCAILVATSWVILRVESPTDQQPQPMEPRRLSIVVMPFVNAGNERADDQLAAALSEDVTTSLAQIPGAIVIARSMAVAVAQRRSPLPAVGRELGVRYVLEGTLRRSADSVECGVQLSDASTGTSIWAAQFQGSFSEARDQIERTLLFRARAAFMDVEAARLSVLPPAELRAEDLLLIARAAANHQPITPTRNAEIIKTLEHALELDPNSTEIMITLAFRYLNGILQFNLRGPKRQEYLLRARDLGDSAKARAAGSESMLSLQAALLRIEERHEEAIAAYTALTVAHPTRAIYFSNLARSLILVGRSAEAVPLLKNAIELDRGEVPLFAVYGTLGQALIRLGRDEEAVDWLRAAKEQSAGLSPQFIEWLAIAYAHTARIEAAQRELQEFIRQRPTHTLRERWHEAGPTEAATEEHRREVDGLAIAGLRDHVEEDEDAGLSTRIGLKPNLLISPTPVGALGVSIIRTDELNELVSRGNAENQGSSPLLLSSMCSACFDIAFPGAITIPPNLRTDPMDDKKRQALKAWLDPLVGDPTRRLIVMSWNAERWNARNTALELVALGYPNVAWYRGGLEAWDAAGLPVQSR